jgi:transcriptional regulator with XRE-family HTH domain
MLKSIDEHGERHQMASPGSKKRLTRRASERPTKTSFAVLVEKQTRIDPAFRSAWKALEPKRRVVAALLRLRSQANLSQKEVAERAGWHPAFVSRLESFPREGEKLYMPDLATLVIYAAACGCDLGLVFGRATAPGARIDIAATASFGDKKGFRRAMARLTGTQITVPPGGAP